MNLIRSATISVVDATAAAKRYVDWFDYQIMESGRLDAELAKSWGAAAMAGNEYVIARPASDRKADVRFIQSEPVAGYRPLRSFGWAAIEICVQDVMAVHAKMQNSPFVVIGPPNPILSLPIIHPMQVRSPDGEIVYLTEIKKGGPGSGLPDVHVPIDKLFICVLGCKDMEKMARWYSDQLGLALGEEMAIPYRMINQAFDLPKETLHRLRSADHGGDIFLEFDQYPENAEVRVGHPGQLPPGISLCTFSHPDIDAIPGPWLTQPTVRSGAIYEGQRVGVLQSPEGTLVEIVEMAKA